MSMYVFPTPRSHPDVRQWYPLEVSAKNRCGEPAPGKWSKRLFCTLSKDHAKSRDKSFHMAHTIEGKELAEWKSGDSDASVHVDGGGSFAGKVEDIESNASLIPSDAADEWIHEEDLLPDMTPLDWQAHQAGKIMTWEQLSKLDHERIKRNA